MIGSKAARVCLDILDLRSVVGIRLRSCGKSGLVERDSSLFEDLQKYFLHLNFEGVEDSIKMTDELKEYPHHYFSSLLKMALCV